MTPTTIPFKAPTASEPDVWEAEVDVPAGRYRVVVAWGVDGPAECQLVPVGPLLRVRASSGRSDRTEAP